MKRIGIIDIGSNSVRLVVVELGIDNSFKIFDELKEAVRLGDDLANTSELTLTKIEKAIQTLKMFKDLCDAVEVTEIIAVATAAVRQASNGAEFLAEVKQEIGLTIQLLSGDEEAYSDYWGVINSTDIVDGLIMDIGGGSTELIWVKDRKIAEKISLPIGSINLTENFHLTDKITEAQDKALKLFLQNTFRSVPWLSKNTHLNLIGVGGTFRNLGKIDRNRKNYPLDITHNYRMTSADVQEIYQLVLLKSLAQRKKIDGLSKERADIFVGATAAISSLLDFCGINQVIISGSGLREGLIFQQLCQNCEPFSDVLDFSINNIMTKFNLNKNHAQHVYHLTDSLFWQLKDLHHIEHDVQKIIKTASLLHDSGIHLRYYNHHEHSFYIILNSALYGLTQRELLMSAYVAASHRKDPFHLNWLKYSGVIDKSDMEIIRKIGILLRIAESLDRGMTGLITDVHCTVTASEVTIKTISRGNPELEIYNALTAAKQFKKIYQRDLAII